MKDQIPLFISHCTIDKEIANVISEALQKLSLDNILTWFSSDSSATGGLFPGDIWFDRIVTKLLNSKALIVLITPNSINRPWIYFESGIAQGLKHCEIIPVCVGINKDEVFPPLGNYFCYQLSDYSSLKEFFSKLFGILGLGFYEEYTKEALKQILSNIQIAGKNKQIIDKKQPIDILKVIEDFKSHIDKRFIGIMNSPINNFTQKTPSGNLLYTISIEILLGDYSINNLLK